MKKCILCLLFAVSLTAIFCTAACESTETSWIAGDDEWSWDPGSYNTFTGEIALSKYTGQEITIVMTTSLSYPGETEKDSRPVFTVINGKRITMLNQDNTIHCFPDSEHPNAFFSGSMKLPERQHLRQIAFQFMLTDQNGHELETVTCQISNDSVHSNSSGGAIYIPFSIATITMITGCTAAIIWAAAIIRNRKIRNHNRME